MKNVNPLMLVAVLLWVVCGAAWAGGSIEFSGGFSGGTVPNAVVLTGDNASGTGTLRIRPSDEDTQLVLCEASNNSSPEMCSSFNHVNATSTSFLQMTTNGYMNSAASWTRFNTSAGTTGIYTQASTTNASNVIGQLLYSTNNTISGSALFGVTGAGTSTYTIGQNGTVTTDIRGPITNGGSATCNGVFAGAVCYTDDIVVAGSGHSIINLQPGTTSTAAGVTFNVAGAAVGSSAYYGSASADADYADKFVYAGFSKLVSFIRADNVGDGTAAFEWRDNAAGTGVLLADIDGVGRIRPLLYASQSNCSDGAGAAACSAAPAGSVVIDDGATTVVVSTTAVTANSQIFPVFDSSLGTKLGVTCNTTAVTPSISARTAGTSFTITAADPAGANPACFSYLIVN